MTRNPPASLRDQLAPFAARMRESRALVRPVSQVRLRLPPARGVDRFANTVDEILQWVNHRAGQRLPDDAWQRRSFELGAVGAQRAAAVALAQPRYWAARLDDADKEVAQRTWITEIGVGIDDQDAVIFGARLTCATRGQDVPFDRSVPGFIRSVLRHAPALLDGRAMPLDPVFLDSPADVNGLVALLEDPERQHPVIALALPEDGRDPSLASIGAALVRRRTLGAAHVCILSGAASFHLSDRIGKEMSVFRQAVRLYRPGFHHSHSDPYNHPLTLPGRIAAWDGEGAAAYVDWLVGEALSITAHAANSEEVLPTFETVRHLASKAQRQAAQLAGTGDAALLALADAEIKKLEASLHEQKQTYDGLITDLEQQLADAQESQREAASQLANFRQRVATMAATAMSSGATTQVPTSLANFEAWCQSNLTGSVTVLGRALRGVKQSVYEQPSLIYEALLLLRDFYVPMRRDGTVEAKERFEAGLRRLKLENSLIGESKRFNGAQYSVRFGGRPREFEWHLKRGDARDRTHCFRLYYFWDDETQNVIVGWLPSHLDNALT